MYIVDWWMDSCFHQFGYQNELIIVYLLLYYAEISLVNKNYINENESPPPLSNAYIFNTPRLSVISDSNILRIYLRSSMSTG